MRVALIGLVAIVAFELLVSGFDEGRSVTALGTHLAQEAHTLINLALLPTAFELITGATPLQVASAFLGSYGVNAALLRHGVTLRQLRERYLSPSLQALPDDRVAEYEGRYYSGWPARKDVQFIGLDTSKEATVYARMNAPVG